MRRVPCLICLVCLGCHALPTPVGPDTRVASAALLEQAGQALEAGDTEAACGQLRRYVEANPDAPAVRAFYGEVLYRLDRSAEARAEFQLAVAALQLEPRPDTERLVHCHARLLDLAAAEADEYATRLHRGIGLYLLAQRRSAGEEVSAESILCKAALELIAAHAVLPEEARPCWYLHLVWRDLGQAHAAQRWLAECQQHAPLSFLTPAERDGLDLRADPPDLRR